MTNNQQKVQLLKSIIEVFKQYGEFNKLLKTMSLEGYTLQQTKLGGYNLYTLSNDNGSFLNLSHYKGKPEINKEIKKPHDYEEFLVFLNAYILKQELDNNKTIDTPSKPRIKI